MIKNKRLFFKQFFSLFLITNFFGFKLKQKKILTKKTSINKKKSTNFVWYLNINDK